MAEEGDTVITGVSFGQLDKLYDKLDIHSGVFAWSQYMEGVLNTVALDSRSSDIVWIYTGTNLLVEFLLGPLSLNKS